MRSARVCVAGEGLASDGRGMTERLVAGRAYCTIRAASYLHPLLP
ncbi:hypothetical protein A3768_2988 [Ralstonia solanacearum]|nr:hypothetical protein A3768_2988 [Ralstonia solanacearum]